MLPFERLKKHGYIKRIPIFILLAIACLLDACIQSEAIENMKRKNEKAVNDQSFHHRMDSLLFRREFTTAQQIAKQRQKEFPSDNILLNLQLGKIYKAKGSIDSAIEKFTAVIELDNKNISARIQRGWLFVQTDKLNEAIDDFTIASKINPDILFDLGYAFEKNNLTEQAINSYAAYLKNHPQSNSCKKKIATLEAKMKTQVE